MRGFCCDQALQSKGRGLGKMASTATANELALLLDHEIAAVVTAMRQKAGRWSVVPSRYGVSAALLQAPAL